MFNGGGGGRRVRPLGGTDPDDSDPELDSDGEGVARGNTNGVVTCRGNIGRGEGVVRGNKVGGLLGPKGRGDRGTGEDGGGDRGGGTGDRGDRGRALWELYTLDAGRGCRLAGEAPRTRTGGGDIAPNLDCLDVERGGCGGGMSGGVGALLSLSIDCLEPDRGGCGCGTSGGVAVRLSDPLDEVCCDCTYALT